MNYLHCVFIFTNAVIGTNVVLGCFIPYILLSLISCHFSYHFLDLLSFGTDRRYIMEHEILLRIHPCVNSASVIIYMMNKLLFLVSSDTKPSNLDELPN